MVKKHVETIKCSAKSLARAHIFCNQQNGFYESQFNKSMTLIDPFFRCAQFKIARTQFGIDFSS